MKIHCLFYVLLLTGCIGDKVEPDYIHHPKVKIPKNEICIYAANIGDDYIYDFINITKNKNIESIGYDMRQQKIDARNCIPQDVLKFESGQIYSIKISIKNIKNGDVIIYTASIHIYENNERDFYVGNSLLK